MTWSDGCVSSRQPLGVEWAAEAPARIQRLTAAGPAPLWLTSPVRVAGRDGVSLVAAGDPDPWLAPAVAALRAVRGQPLGALSAGWSGCVSVQVPADVLGLARLTGLPSSEASAAAALTYSEPATPGAARVAVNPALARLPGDARRAALIHEFVHVATGSTARGGPAWAREGLAEAVTVGQVPSARRERDGLVRDALALGVGPGLPADADLLATDPGRQRRGYALASVAVEALVSHVGREEASRVLAALAGEGETGTTVAEITRWYRRRLAGFADG